MDEILAALRKTGRSAFKTNEYAALLGKGGYARLILHRLKKKGELIPVKRGWWAFSDALPEAVACEVSQPSYVSFHSALFLHSLTTQIPRTIQLAVARNAREYAIPGAKVKEYKVKKEQFKNFSRKDGVLLAFPEKAVADCLAIPRACPEIVLYEAVRGLDSSKVKELISSKAAEMRLKRVVRHAGKERSE